MNKTNKIKKDNLLKDTLEKINPEVDWHDEEFCKYKDNKLNKLNELKKLNKNSIDIDELADINIGDDLPVTEKKTKLGNFKK